jgi:carboxyl-terminal processing protease
MKKQHYLILIFSILLIITPFGDHSKILQADESEYYARVQKGLYYFQKVYEKVQAYYVEEIDPYEFLKAGIEGMLNSLDPYTVFVEEEGDVRLKMITTGKYGGLGMEIGTRNNRITVISPLDNSPAKRAGIQAGDIIEKINGKSISTLSPEKISQQLRGPVNTTVKLTISRLGYDREITMNIKREEIVIEDVKYADFYESGVAYVRLAGFTEKAASELKYAIKNLQKKGNIEVFILDLRGNSGGLLESAVEIAGIFLPRNTKIVSTRGYRDEEHSFNTKSKPLLLDVPMALLVDEGSASASEIVAGALQDLDRAVIIGTNTFGKGLVQKVYNIDKNSSTKVKITTAKYYIPSGRCVQKENYAKDSKIFPNKINDNLAISQQHIAYYTSNNREVYEKGGITPDLYLENGEIHYIVTELWRQSIPFNFAVKYHQEFPAWKGELTITDEVFNSFITFVKESEFNYEIEGEKEIKKFLEVADEHDFPQEVINTGESLYSKLQDIKENDLRKHKEQISKILLDELIEKYYGNKEKIRISLLKDEQFHTAIDVLQNNKQYKKILAIK